MQQQQKLAKDNLLFRTKDTHLFMISNKPQCKVTHQIRQA